MSNETIGQEPIRMRPKLSSQAKREVRRDSRLRRARTCYGHLAGVAGVALMDKMIGLGWLEEGPRPASGNRVGYALTHKGLQAMAERGVDVAAAAKSTGNFAFGCLDWTERGHHLGGALGRAVTAFLSEQGFVGRTPGTREVTLRGCPDFWLDGAAPRR
ncbi:MAG: hypothetical protein IIA92_04560 [Chloroflexi bacterium]|nr:hypothetical protein [Chloroflexota bacterium]